MSEKFEFKFPFEPPWEDLKMELTASNGVKVYIFDSCVEHNPEKRAQLDRNVAEVLMRADRRKLMQELEDTRQ